MIFFFAVVCSRIWATYTVNTHEHVRTHTHTQRRKHTCTHIHRRVHAHIHTQHTCTVSSLWQRVVVASLITYLHTRKFPCNSACQMNASAIISKINWNIGRRKIKFHQCENIHFQCEPSTNGLILWLTDHDIHVASVVMVQRFSNGFGGVCYYWFKQLILIWLHRMSRNFHTHAPEKFHRENYVAPLKHISRGRKSARRKTKRQQSKQKKKYVLLARRKGKERV